MNFVVSIDPSTKGFGVGKQVDPQTNPGLIHYFVSPADDLVERVVQPESITEVELYPQERIFYIEDNNTWRVGRLVNYYNLHELDLLLPNSQT